MKRKNIGRLAAVALSAVLLSGNMGQSYAMNVEEVPEKEETKASVAIETMDESDPENRTVYLLTGSDGKLNKIIAGQQLLSVHPDLQEEIPIRMQVSYFLDGKEMKPEEIAGKSGHAVIRYDYENLAQETVKVDDHADAVSVPFLVVTGMVLDQDIFNNVEVRNGKVLDDGSRYMVAGYAVPGLQKTLALPEDAPDIPDHVEISADVKNFEMGMTLTVVSNDLFSELKLDRLDEVRDRLSSVSELTDAMTALEDGMSELQSGAVDLQTGTGTLQEGAGTLQTGAGTLQSGTASLKNGAASLQTGGGTLQDGALRLQNGAAALSEGLNTLNGNSETLNAGAKQVFDALVLMAADQLREAGFNMDGMTAENYADHLMPIISALDEDAVYQKALDQVTAGVEAKRDEISAMVTEAVRQEVASAVTEAARSEIRTAVEANVREQVRNEVGKAVRETVRAAILQEAVGMTAEEYDRAVEAGLIDEKTQQAVDAALEEKLGMPETQQLMEEQTQSRMDSEEVQAVISSHTEEQLGAAEIQEHISQTIAQRMDSEEVQALILTNTENQIQKAIADTMAGDAVQEQLKQALEGAQKVISLKTSLDSYSAFYQGLLSYTAAVGQAAQGAADLKTGMDTLKGGIDTLKSGLDDLKTGADTLDEGACSLKAGMDDLKTGTDTLKTGMDTLKDGATALMDGLKELDEEGIQKLTDLLENDLESLLNRLKAAQDAEDQYLQETSKEAGTSESAADAGNALRFIFRTGEIHIREENK